MAQWAYAARSCAGGHVLWVARDDVDAMAPEVAIVRVKVGAEWRCARIDRQRAVAVEAHLLRPVVASDLQDCTDCAPAAAAGPATATLADLPPQSHGVHAAAITIAGHNMVVVLVPIELVRSPGEAGMLVEDLRPGFGGADIVLMGQNDDGTPAYYGEAASLALLADVPVSHMPWQVYPPGREA